MKMSHPNSSNAVEGLSETVLMLLSTMVLICGFVPGNAQSEVTIGGGDFQGGVWGKTIPGVLVPAGEGLTVNATLGSPRACAMQNLVDVNRMKNAILTAGSDGTLSAKLADIENNLNGDLDAAVGVLRRIVGGYDGGAAVRPIGTSVVFRANSSARQAWSTGQSITVSPYADQSNNPFAQAGLVVNSAFSGCLELTDVRGVLQRLQAIIRLVLKLPPA